ncbi:hypothetical protein [Clostridium cibarium]|uniref:Uncharacterized protein n=1 Tax=Clostridium cibarium TaxID=2762247 RepID=A0ABR8PSJ6_9CLOT|nr:hypothetical protein [Clostridium cibarium]MBD7911150.1 hypothetical protein [Clostridium cibarium]
MKVKISLKELEKKNVVYIKNIQEGFDRYPNSILEGTEEHVNDVIRKLFSINGVENSYADFYYGRLNEEEKGAVKNILDEKEIILIESFKLCPEDIFIRLNSEILEILLKLTAREVLFSSFYFTKYPCLIWGNYNRRYPVFFKDDSIMNMLLNKI